VLIKRQLYRVRPAVRVLFFSAFNIGQLPSVPSIYDPIDPVIRNQPSRNHGHFPFSDTEEFNLDLAQDLQQWAEIPQGLRCGAIVASMDDTGTLL
jgi:hypothetical protein